MEKLGKTFSELDPEAILNDLMQSSDVVFCTLVSSGSRLLHKLHSVDALVVDEAAAATETLLCIPFHCSPKRLLIVGDPKQLPSTVLSDRAKKFGFDTSLHERLMHHCSADYVMLDVQYRMHPSISEFPSRTFYQGKILDGANVKQQDYQRGPLLLDGRPFVFLQLECREAKSAQGGVYNLNEADAIVQLVRKVPNRDNADRLRIITFYSAQVALLQKKLEASGMENVLVSTVDAAQGTEADLVIVSFVRSDWAGFLDDDRRMNVALTRARHQLVCVGNIKRFPQMRPLTIQSLAANAQERSVVLPFHLTQQHNTIAPIQPPPSKKVKLEPGL